MTHPSMPTGYGKPDPQAPVRVGLRRSNMAKTWISLILLCIAVWLSFVYAISPSGSRFLGVTVGLAFGIPLVKMLFALPRSLARQYVVLDSAGLHIRHGRHAVSVPWPEVMAIGLGYQQAPGEKWKLPTSIEDVAEIARDYAADKVLDALNASRNRRIALEIIPARPDVSQRYPKLKPYWSDQPPPYPGLPPQQWSLPLPPVVTIGQEVEQGVRTFQPQRWMGWYARPWSG